MRIPTVSHRDPALVDTAAFDAFHAELERQFPLLHARLETTRVEEHALLARWPGRSSARPLVLMAHLDVVPVDEGRPGSTRRSAPTSWTARSGAAAPSTTRGR